MKHFEDVNKARQKLLKPETVLAALFLEMHKADEGERSPTISPSGLNCQVSQAWKLQGVPVEPSVESFQSSSFAEAGEDRHARIQAFLSKTPYWVDVEQYVKERVPDLEVVERQGYEVLLYSKKYHTRFRCDGMLLLDGTYYVLEIKTEGQQQNDARQGHNIKHTKQGLSYALMLNTRDIMWVYEGRAFFTQHCFAQSVSDADRAWIDKYLTEILVHKDSPEELSKDPTACPYCEYKTHCKAYFKGVKKGEQNG